eukprot:4211258-Prymnesium_polylepis.1
METIKSARAVLRSGEELAASQNRLALNSEAATRFEELSPSEVIVKEFADLKQQFRVMQERTLDEVRLIGSAGGSAPRYYDRMGSAPPSNPTSPPPSGPASPPSSPPPTPSPSPSPSPSRSASHGQFALLSSPPPSP